MLFSITQTLGSCEEASKMNRFLASICYPIRYRNIDSRFEYTLHQAKTTVLTPFSFPLTTPGLMRFRSQLFLSIADMFGLAVVLLIAIRPGAHKFHPVVLFAYSMSLVVPSVIAPENVTVLESHSLTALVSRAFSRPIYSCDVIPHWPSYRNAGLL